METATLAAADGKLEAWRDCWRRGFVPLLSVPALEALQRALEADDRRLLQGVTTRPPALECVRDWAVEGACAIGFAGWIGDGLETVEEVEAYFGRLCLACDEALGEPAACRWFLNWVDDTPREEMRRSLLPEVGRALARIPFYPKEKADGS